MLFAADTERLRLKAELLAREEAEAAISRVEISFGTLSVISYQ
jgi:hypothetical protein